MNVFDVLQQDPLAYRHGDTGQTFSATLRNAFLQCLSVSRARDAIPLPKKRNKDGLTPLHLCAQKGLVAIAQLLLTHPEVDVNAVDTENGWTALHRAVYEGNADMIALLVGEDRLDTSIRDNSGLTAWDLLCETVEADMPIQPQGHLELFTWGSNDNMTLCHPDNKQRALPDRVTVTDAKQPFVVRRVVLQKYHTAVLLEAPKNNLLMAGHGRGGRLGLGHEETVVTLHTVLGLTDIGMKEVALGKDHSVALTTNGNVYTWGDNKAKQLGYNGKAQLVPKKVAGLRHVIGSIAASDHHTAAASGETLYTWGYNEGQLGHLLDDGIHSTHLPNHIVQVACTNSATMVMVVDYECYIFHNFTRQRVMIPMPRSIDVKFTAYLPAHSAADGIIEVYAGKRTFALRGEAGHVYWVRPPTEAQVGDKFGSRVPRCEVQHLWTPKTKAGHARAVALSGDDAALVVTATGQVWKGALPTKQKQTIGKLSRVPLINRCCDATASVGGNFAVIRHQPLTSLSPVEAMRKALQADAEEPALSAEVCEAAAQYQFRLSNETVVSLPLDLTHALIRRSRFVYAYCHRWPPADRIFNLEAVSPGVWVALIAWLRWQEVPLDQQEDAACKVVLHSVSDAIFDLPADKAGLAEKEKERHMAHLKACIAAADALSMGTFRMLAEIGLASFLTLHHVIDLALFADAYHCHHLLDAAFDTLLVNQEALFENKSICALPSWLLCKLSAKMKAWQMKSTPYARVFCLPNEPTGYPYHTEEAEEKEMHLAFEQMEAFIKREASEIASLRRPSNTPTPRKAPKATIAPSKDEPSPIAKAKVVAPSSTPTKPVQAPSLADALVAIEHKPKLPRKKQWKPLDKVSPTELPDVLTSPPAEQFQKSVWQAASVSSAPLRQPLTPRQETQAVVESAPKERSAKKAMPPRLSQKERKKRDKEPPPAPTTPTKAKAVWGSEKAVPSDGASLDMRHVLQQTKEAKANQSVGQARRQKVSNGVWNI